MAAKEMTATRRNNLDELTARQRAEASGAPFSERLATRITCFTGSMTFVLLHLVAYGFWILINLGGVPGIPPFDPTFVVLAMEASVDRACRATMTLPRAKQPPR